MEVNACNEMEEGEFQSLFLICVYFILFIKVSTVGYLDDFLLCNLTHSLKSFQLPFNLTAQFERFLEKLSTSLPQYSKLCQYQ